MPVESKPHIAAQHQANQCSFCNSSEEKISHSCGQACVASKGI